MDKLSSITGTGHLNIIFQIPIQQASSKSKKKKSNIPRFLQLYLYDIYIPYIHIVMIEL